LTLVGTPGNSRCFEPPTDKQAGSTTAPRSGDGGRRSAANGEPSASEVKGPKAPQQSVPGSRIIILLRAKANRITDLVALVPELVSAIPIAKTGVVTAIGL
jgi:hypothetical protein